MNRTGLRSYLIELASFFMGYGMLVEMTQPCGLF